MTISEDWRPAAGDAPAYARIVERLAADIEAGDLTAGARLPTQRALAEQLGVGLGTVTRAYAEAESRGLIEAVVGRGSFVSRRRAADTGLVDLSRNVPLLAPVEAALREGLAAMARRTDLAERLDYAPAGGFGTDRRAGAEWLRRTSNFPAATADALVCTAGAQQSIAVSLMALCRPGDAVIAESATFNGVKLIAGGLGLKLRGAEMDAEGVTPEALVRAVSDSGARVAYLQPFQNPTARVMGLARRREIVAVAERLDLTIVEDDLYGAYVADLGLPPLAALAPDHVAYVSGLSKTLATGLRVGFLIPPERTRAAMLEALQAIAFGSPAFGAALATRWIESGEAARIFGLIRGELTWRGDLARGVFGAAMEPLTQHTSPHLWLPLSELEAERVAGRALRAGAKLTPPRAPFLPGAPVTGLRVCLGSAPDRTSLERGLRAVSAALVPGHGESAI